MSNPLQALCYGSPLECLENDYFDPVQPVTFPHSILRFRNDDLVCTLGLRPDQVQDQYFVEFRRLACQFTRCNSMKWRTISISTICQTFKL